MQYRLDWISIQSVRTVKACQNALLHTLHLVATNGHFATHVVVVLSAIITICTIQRDGASMHKFVLDGQHQECVQDIKVFNKNSEISAAYSMGKTQCHFFDAFHTCKNRRPGRHNPTTRWQKKYASPTDGPTKTPGVVEIEGSSCGLAARHLEGWKYVRYI